MENGIELFQPFPNFLEMCFSIPFGRQHLVYALGYFPGELLDFVAFAFSKCVFALVDDQVVDRYYLSEKIRDIFCFWILKAFRDFPDSVQELVLR